VISVFLQQKKFVFLFVIIFLFQRCTGKKEKFKDQGIISFKVECVDMNHPMAALAPSSAELKYNQDKFILEMSTMGVFKTTVIGDVSAKTMAQTVKFLDIKQACIEDSLQIKEEISKYRLKLTPTKETKKICGFVCHKVIAEYVDQPGKTFEVYYTKELGNENCNALTPYADLKGMLMDYRLQRMGLELHFIAKSYKNEEVPLSAFEVPAYMKIVSKKEMQDFFDRIQKM